MELAPVHSKTNPDGDKERGLCLSGADLFELMREILTKGFSFRFQARGGSMSPFIRDGDFISISPVGKTAPRMGEVVAFVHPGTRKPIVHRIVGKKGGAYLIKGDSIPHQVDGYISPQNILGRVSRIECEGLRGRLGFGPERLVIAFFSRTGLLSRIKLLIQPVLHPLQRVVPRRRSPSVGL